MPSMTIYLNNDLFDYVKNDASKIIQKALREMIERENTNMPKDNDTGKTDATISDEN